MRLIGRIGIALAVLMVLGTVCDLGVSSGPEVEADSTLVVRLGGTYLEASEPALVSRLLGEERATFAALLSQLSMAERDERIKTVVLRIRSLGIGWGKAQELRGAVARLRTAGRHTVAYLDLASLTAHREYFIAAAADEVVLVPGGTAPLVGLSAHYQYLGGLFEKIGITFEVGKAGRYKSAVEAFSGTEMSEASREMANSLLDSTERQFVSGIAAGRNLSVDQVVERIGRGLILGSELVALGFVDSIASLEDVLDGLGGEVIYESTYAAVDPADVGISPEATFALLYGSGNVVDGEREANSMGAPVFSAGAFTRALEQAAEADDIEAIIVRIDSPGGSALASERMWRAVRRARDDSGKPIIASFSDVAASGGYYVAAATDAIVAPGMSITGSIGVFALVPILEGLQRKVGISSEFLSRGEDADFGSTSSRWSDSAREKLQRMVLAIYSQFVERVALGRNLEVARVDAVAQGRVWTGAQALERGLVDELGGLHEAVARANVLLGLAPDADIELRTYPPVRTLPEQLADLLDVRVARAVQSRLDRIAPFSDLLDLAAELPMQTPLLIPPATVQIQ